MAPKPTKPKWWFPENTSGQRTFKDPLAGLINPTSELDSTEILVRESLQNSLDARASSSEPVRVRFRLRTLRGKKKLQLLEALGLDSLGPHVDASNRAIIANQGDPMSDPDRLREEDPVVGLYLEDHATSGLLGPELFDSESGQDYNGPKCFLGLCRSVGVNDKASGGAGGTYGFGKGVYWANSSMGTVVFHSRLATPWSAGPDEDLPEGEGALVHERFFGVARLTSHTCGKTAHDENGYLAIGHVENLGPRSYWNEGAATHAAALGFEPRSERETGTSILVAPLRDDEDGSGRAEVLRDAAPYAEKLRRAAAYYFWPAIQAGRLVVEVQVDENDARLVRPADFAELRHYLEIDAVLASGKKNEQVETAEITAEVPAWKEKGIDAQTTKARLGAQIDDKEESRPTEPGPGPGRIALVRGAHMVVGYWNPPSRGGGGTNFRALVRAGLANSDSEADKALELMLQRAEPITHDRWDPKSEPLKPWHAAQSRVRDLLGSVRKSLSDLVQKEEHATGPGPLALRKLLALEGDGVNQPHRWGKISFPSPDERTYASGNAQLQRKVEVEIPAPRKGRPRPDQVRIHVSHGVKKDEASTTRTKEVVVSGVDVLEREGIQKESIQVSALEGGAVALTLDLSGNSERIRLRLLTKTQPMPVERFSRRQFDRRIQIQVPAQEDSK